MRVSEKMSNVKELDIWTYERAFSRQIDKPV